MSRIARPILALLVAGAPVLAAAQGTTVPAPTPSEPYDRYESRADRCERLFRAFDRSAACYARFRTVHGMRPEAFERCGPPVPDPAGECVRRTGGGTVR